MLKNLLYAILLGVGMAACLADTDDTGTATTTSNVPPETSQAEDTAATPDPAHFVVTKGRVGTIRIGMPIAEMRQQVPVHQQIKDTTLHLEGQAYTAYVYSSPTSPSGLLVEQQCEPDCQVWRIRLRDDDYKTPEGIGVGSKYGEVRQRYPIKYASLGEAGFVAVSEEAGMSFILDTSQLDKSQLHALKPDDIPANTLVRGILLY
ncbi:hypothetical protein [Pontibacter roseus]|uniref:hypothetical protein n=1 Tax=Pontibacter roseus TaxID=336989 RepID=UPI0003815928|nr:hypothetical protein [Pontibacter roseus]